MSNPIEKWLGHATVWDWLTNVTGIIAILMLMLLIYGFRRYVKRPRTAPIDFLGTGIWILALLQLARLVWWDILPDAFDLNWHRDYSITSKHVNWIFNSLIIVGVWYKLHGYWQLVEARAPGQYNTFTAVFYPKRLKMWLESRNGSKENTDE